MKSVGGLLLMVGLGQAIFQAYVWLASDYWPHFTNGDLLTELGIGLGLAHIDLGAAGFLRDASLGAELSFSLIAFGAMTTLIGPLRRMHDNLHAARLIRRNRHNLTSGDEASRLRDRFASHH